MSSATIFGGAALSRVTQAEADETLTQLLNYGVNHIDTAASYGDSELRIGPWMERHRHDFFLATKTGSRTYEGAKKELENSLRRLRVESVDLIQLHNLVHPDDWDTAMGEGGALEAVVEAKEQGLTRFVGVTGHGLLAAAMHRRSLNRHPFDSVLLPWNYVMSRDERYRREFEALVTTCKDRGVAIQTIKSITRGPWAHKPQTTSTWYEPLEEPEDIALAVSWILGQENIFLNTASDTHILPRILEAAGKHRERPKNEEMEDLVKRKCMSRLFVS